jgi:hypothetical protein
MHEDDRIRKIAEKQKRIQRLSRRIEAQEMCSSNLRGRMYYLVPLFQQYDSECRELNRLTSRMGFKPRAILRKKATSEA